MKALVKYAKGKGNVRIEDIPEPTCDHDSLILEVEYCGICGTDIHVYNDTFKNYPPVVLGHEFSGKVLEKGHNVKSTNIGDAFAVLGATAVTCGCCDFCLSGEFMFCKHRRGMGHGVNGAFTRYVKVRPDQLFKIPQNVPIKHGALMEPLAAAVHAACEVADTSLGDTVLVSGPGPIGLLCVKLLVHQSINVIVAGSSQDEKRLQVAKKMGARRTVNVEAEDLSDIVVEETTGKGVDIAFETAGVEGSVSNCLSVLGPLGTYVQVGHFGKQLHVPWDHIAFKQLRILGSLGYTHETWRKTIKIMENGFDPSEIISHELELSSWEKGFEICKNKEAVKVLLTPIK